MITTRYTGEDIPIDLTLTNYDGSLIDPTAFVAITIYLMDVKGSVLAKFKDPETEGYEPLEVDAAKVRLWLQSALTKTLKDKKMKLEVNIEEYADELDDDAQNTIIKSDEFQITYAAIGAESHTSV